MVKFNGTSPDNYNRSLRNRNIENENRIQKNVKRRPGRPSKRKPVIAEEPQPSVPNADEQLALSVKLQYTVNHSKELLKSKGKLKGWPVYSIMNSNI
jgi:hypothetical protein